MVEVSILLLSGCPLLEQRRRCWLASFKFFLTQCILKEKKNPKKCSPFPRSVAHSDIPHVLCQQEKGKEIIAKAK